MTQAFFRSCLRTMLRPIARFCIHHSIGVQEALEELKSAMLRVAQEDLRSSGEHMNVSKLSAMTGVHRPDVRRICQREEERTEPQNQLSKLIGRWQSDRRYLRKDGSPRVLRITDTENEFADLVKDTCSDFHHGTMLAELERLKLVKQVPSGLCLMRGPYITRDLKEAYAYMSEDVADLMTAVQLNVSEGEAAQHLHLSTIYDRVVESAIPKIQKWLLKEGSAFHRKVHKYLSQFDYDANPKLARGEPVHRVALGSFSLTRRKEKKAYDKKH